jgi:hypothetical protein
LASGKINENWTHNRRYGENDQVSNLIDFQEHSVENVAEALEWEDIDRYGLIGRVSQLEPSKSVLTIHQVLSFMMDDSTNNDPLVAAIEKIRPNFRPKMPAHGRPHGP